MPQITVMYAAGLPFQPFNVNIHRHIFHFAAEISTTKSFYNL
jgi:hypothetical protein